RIRQERRFPAAIPDRSLVAYSWLGADPSGTIFDSLQLLAHHTPYIGHSSSVVRCFFHRKQTPEQYGPRVPSSQRIYRDRLEELERDFFSQRHSSRGASVPRKIPARVSLPASNLGRCWHVFADAGGYCPDLRACALVAQAFRRLILSGYGGRPAPEII